MPARFCHMLGAAHRQLCAAAGCGAALGSSGRRSLWCRRERDGRSRRPPAPPCRHRRAAARAPALTESLDRRATAGARLRLALEVALAELAKGLSVSRSPAIRSRRQGHGVVGRVVRSHTQRQPPRGAGRPKDTKSACISMQCVAQSGLPARSSRFAEPARSASTCATEAGRRRGLSRSRETGASP